MAGEDRGPRAWHDVHSVQEAPREKQKSSGRIAAEEAAARKKIEALRALRLAKQAAEPPPPPATKKPAKGKAAAPRPRAFGRSSESDTIDEFEHAYAKTGPTFRDAQGAGRLARRHPGRSQQDRMRSSGD